MEFAGWKNLRTADFRYLVHADGSELLWDLRVDPGEYSNVSNDPAYALELAEHRRLLLQKLLQLEQPLDRIIAIERSANLALQIFLEKFNRPSHRLVEGRRG
ncbi:MAG: hypothetical protein IPM07_26950 [Anaerolineales bacterium]|nr:hypothetical protein [Anaerolineales bacterium]